MVYILCTIYIMCTVLSFIIKKRYTYFLTIFLYFLYLVYHVYHVYRFFIRTKKIEKKRYTTTVLIQIVEKPLIKSTAYHNIQLKSFRKSRCHQMTVCQTTNIESFLITFMCTIFSKTSNCSRWKFNTNSTRT